MIRTNYEFRRLAERYDEVAAPYVGDGQGEMGVGPPALEQLVPID